MLTSSSGTDYIPNEHEDIDQYDPYAIPSEIMPCSSRGNWSANPPSPMGPPRRLSKGPGGRRRAGGATGGGCPGGGLAGVIAMVGQG